MTDAPLSISNEDSDEESLCAKAISVSICPINRTYDVQSPSTNLPDIDSASIVGSSGDDCSTANSVNIPGFSEQVSMKNDSNIVTTIKHDVVISSEQQPENYDNEAVGQFSAPSFVLPNMGGLERPPAKRKNQSLSVLEPRPDVYVDGMTLMLATPSKPSKYTLPFDAPQEVQNLLIGNNSNKITVQGLVKFLKNSQNVTEKQDALKGLALIVAAEYSLKVYFVQLGGLTLLYDLLNNFCEQWRQRYFVNKPNYVQLCAVQSCAFTVLSFLDLLVSDCFPVAWNIMFTESNCFLSMLLDFIDLDSGFLVPIEVLKSTLNTKVGRQRVLPSADMKRVPLEVSGIDGRIARIFGASCHSVPFSVYTIDDVTVCRNKDLIALDVLWKQVCEHMLSGADSDVSVVFGPSESKLADAGFYIVSAVTAASYWLLSDHSTSVTLEQLKILYAQNLNQSSASFDLYEHTLDPMTYVLISQQARDKYFDPLFPFYRGLVLHHNGTQLDVLAVDFGTFERLYVEDAKLQCYGMPHCLYSIPPAMVLCVLKDYVPAPNRAALKHCLSTLQNATMCGQIATAIVDRGAASLLLKYIGLQCSADIRELALSILENLAIYSTDHSRLLESGVLNRLVYFAVSLVLDEHSLVKQISEVQQSLFVQVLAVIVTLCSNCSEAKLHFWETLEGSSLLLFVAQCCTENETCMRLGDSLVKQYYDSCESVLVWYNFGRKFQCDLVAMLVSTRSQAGSRLCAHDVVVCCESAAGNDDFFLKPTDGAYRLMTWYMKPTTQEPSQRRYFVYNEAIDVQPSTTTLLVMSNKPLSSVTRGFIRHYVFEALNGKQLLTMYFGVREHDASAVGFRLNQSEQEAFELAVHYIMSRDFRPPVDSAFFRVKFVPVWYRRGNAVIPPLDCEPHFVVELKLVLVSDVAYMCLSKKDKSGLLVREGLENQRKSFEEIRRQFARQCEKTEKTCTEMKELNTQIEHSKALISTQMTYINYCCGTKD